MATCTVKLYKVDFTPEMNARVDNLSHYLQLGSRLVVTWNNFQYQQIELNMQLKAVVAEKYVAEKYANYLSIYQDGKTYYYFILGTEWTSQTVVKFNISLDTINTFQDITFTKKTNIIREHRNRWWNTEPLTFSQTKIFPKVDKIDEGVNPTKFSISQETITELTFPHDRKWYLVYKTPTVVEASNPLECFLVPSTTVRLRNAGSAGWYDFPLNTIGDGQYIYFFNHNNTNLTRITYRSGGSDHTVQINQAISSNEYVAGFTIYKDTGRYYVARIIQDLHISSTHLYPTYEYYSREAIDTSATSFRISNSLGYYSTTGSAFQIDPYQIIKSHTLIPLNTSSSALMSTTFSQIDRTDNKIIKIIECPYCPIDIQMDPSNTYAVLPTGWSYTNEGFIKLDNLNTEFLERIKNNHVFFADIYVSLNPGWTRQTRYLEDPKLMHSSFYDYKFLYDNFSIPVYLEMLERPDLTQPMTWAIDYKQSNDITSDCLFKIRNDNWYYTDRQDYDLMIVSNRNNEVTLFNSEYLNYMRTGYNFEKKQKNQEIGKSYLTAGISIIGAAVTALGASASGGISLVAAKTLATTAITSLSNAIIGTAQKEQSFAQKINELQRQSTTVLNTENLNLLNYYNGNKLLLMKWEPSEEMKKNLDDLFYYCGYATNEKRIPNLNTRHWFNYIQCDPVFDETTNNTYNEFISDLKARYNAGVTVYHEAENGSWDFAQQYENWESNLIA